MELKSIPDVKNVKKFGFLDAAKLIIGFAFLLLAMIYTSVVQADGFAGSGKLLIIASIFGCYMALNIGANDVANNIGPAVGSRAVSLFWAIVLAAIFELSGALIAGSDVVMTIKKGIVDSDAIISTDTRTFIWVMMAALLGGAVWLNIATFFGAPVSTTHAIVGGVAGAGVAAVGWGIIKWKSLTIIVSSWIISPFLGGIIAAGLLLFMKKTVLLKDDKKLAAKKIVPPLISFMIFSFVTYILLKGFGNIFNINFLTAVMISLFISLLAYFIIKPLIVKASDRLPNSRRAVNWLFNVPLVFAAAMLSFAHGANDVSNAVGPLAAIADIVSGGFSNMDANIPFWVMFLGASGIAIGLILYGPKLVKTVGSEITELDQVRAFCIAMSAALTVIVASQLGLPVSSTHTAIGGIFGVGFLREWLLRNTLKEEIEIDPKKIHIKAEQKKLEEYKNELESLGKLKKVDPLFVKELITKINEEKRLISKITAHKTHNLEITKIEKKALKAVKKHEFVKRSALKMIIAAWLITVPAVGVLSAMFYYMLRGMML
ncbi:MAG: inorganic phosphate transporter [Campylobacteraceae bacterium]|jgi:PiT family inorganic phosphate transporter|nr:inorganic phosphate transporter [Campylobacteraceae bacterium]